MHERTCQIFTYKTCWHTNDEFEKDAKITLKQYVIDVRFFFPNKHGTLIFPAYRKAKRQNPKNIENYQISYIDIL